MGRGISTLKAICTNPKCRALFTPVNNRQMFCSRKCSAHVRNRRYYCTARGRSKKRLASSRYFQSHKFEVYETKGSRLHGYYKQEVEHRKQEAEEWRKLEAKTGRWLGDPFFETAMTTVRFHHDHHPNPMDGDYIGHEEWFEDSDGKMRLYVVRNGEISRALAELNEIGEVRAL